MSKIGGRELGKGAEGVKRGDMVMGGRQEKTGAKRVEKGVKIKGTTKSTIFINNLIL